MHKKQTEGSPEGGTKRTEVKIIQSLQVEISTERPVNQPKVSYQQGTC